MAAATCGCHSIRSTLFRREAATRQGFGGDSGVGVPVAAPCGGAAATMLRRRRVLRRGACCRRWSGRRGVRHPRRRIVGDAQSRPGTGVDFAWRRVGRAGRIGGVEPAGGTAGTACCGTVGEAAGVTLCTATRRSSISESMSSSEKLGWPREIADQHVVPSPSSTLKRSRRNCEPSELRMMRATRLPSLP